MMMKFLGNEKKMWGLNNTEASALTPWLLVINALQLPLKAFSGVRNCSSLRSTFPCGTNPLSQASTFLETCRSSYVMKRSLARV